MIFSLIVHAAEENIPIAGQIANFYTWALEIGALVALLVLIYGGIVYTTSAGNASRISEAKEWVFGALIGLFILFGSFLILNTINPELIKLKDLKLIVNEAAQPSSSGKGGATYSPQPGDINPSAICVSYLSCRSIYDNDCQGAVCNYPSDVFSEAQTTLLDSIIIPFVSGSAGVRIKSDIGEPLARAGEVANSRGYTLSVSSGYRSLKRQLEIALEDWRKVPATVAYPGGSSHGSGKAVDIVLVGGQSVGSPEYCRTLAEIMYQAGWERYLPEYWHFEYPAGSGNPTRSTSVISC